MRSNPIVYEKRKNETEKSHHSERIIDYLFSVSRLAREAAESRDPKVITTALAVLGSQGPTIRQVIGGSL